MENKSYARSLLAIYTPVPLFQTRVHTQQLRKKTDAFLRVDEIVRIREPTHTDRCARIGRGLVGEGGEWEKEGRKIRKEGWLSDYSPLYMGAAGERGKGWNLLMAAIQPLPAPTPSSSLLHLSVGHLLLLLLFFPNPGSPSPFPY